MYLYYIYNKSSIYYYEFFFSFLGSRAVLQKTCKENIFTCNYWQIFLLYSKACINWVESTIVLISVQKSNPVVYPNLSTHPFFSMYTSNKAYLKNSTS